MLQEHEQGRAYIRAIREHGARLGGGEAGAARSLVAAARGYVALLRDHIVKEDEVLFPMAGQVLSPARMAQVATDFERVEREETGEGAHQRFHAQADRLIAEAGAAAA
jgi:hemerythrin-like domain-containing protein